MSKQAAAWFTFLLVCAAWIIAGSARAQQAPESVSSWPPDLSAHRRAAIAADVRPSAKANVGHGAATSVTIVDVNSFNFDDGSEPSIAVNPAQSGQIVINGGFGGWGDGTDNVSMFVSNNGGSSWNLAPVATPPTGVSAGLSGCPCDTTIDFGAGSAFSGTFLAGPSGAGEGDPGSELAVPAATPTPPNTIYSGTSNDLSSADNWGWFVVSGVTQLTNHLVANSNPDQPWLRVNRDPAVGSQSNVYVAWDDFSLNPVGINVSVAAGTNPPDFIRDQSTGTSAGAINPGTRLAVDPGTGWVYDLFQNCPAGSSGCDTSDGEKTVSYVLNRSIDGGESWGLNGSTTGVVVASAPSTQPRPKFGTVNALLGGIDHLTVDPANGDVYVVYADQSSGKQLIVLRRLVNNQDGLSFGGEQTVSVSGVDSALPSVAVAGGTVGVLYTSFDGMSSGFPQFSAHLATSTNQGAAFTDQTLLTFLSPSVDDGKDRQRVLGDYQQLRAVGTTFYGVFTGNGAALGRSEASSDPIFFTAPGSPTAVASPSAQVTASAVHNKGKPGDTVAAGSFVVINDSNVTETIASATVAVSHPALFSSMALSGGGQVVTATPPTATTTFTFATPIGVPAGGAATLSLTATIAMKTAASDGSIRLAGVVPALHRLTTTHGWSLMAGLMLMGVALLALPDALRRRAAVVAALVIVLAAAAVGCGGGSSGASPAPASDQKVTQVSAAGGETAAPVTGLPAKLGTVSK